MNILIIGSGAREHAIAKALNKSQKKPHLFCYGNSHNPGIQALVKKYEVDKLDNMQKIVMSATEWKIDFAIIGPEALLAEGLSDLLWEKSIPTIGPKKKLAQIETSKAFSRDLLKKYHIPGSPKYKVFCDLNGVKEFLSELGEGNYVVKANALMSGKGVKVAGDHLESFAEAITFCKEIVGSNQSFVIEEKLIGQEFSLMCFCDGTHLVSMPVVQDNKRAFVDDVGPNTGGMGSYSDANHSLPFLTASDLEVAHQINHAVIGALKEECNEKYIGILYGSFIATKTGVHLIEYNARFGDPEALNILSVLESDFVSLCEAMIAGTLSADLVRFANLATVCKYAVPEGYPDSPVVGGEIKISDVKLDDQLYFGGVNAVDGKLCTTGSRCIAVLGVGKTIAEAEEMAEAAIKEIKGPLFYREDIGKEKLIKSRVKHMRELREFSV